MFLNKNERVKHNQAMILFIARMSMLTMIALRNKEDVANTNLPVPNTIGEINEQNETLYRVVTNLINSELKLNVDDVKEDEVLRFKDSSPFNNADVYEIVDKSIDNSGLSPLLADKLLYDLDYIRNTILKAAKEMIEDVELAKASYETARSISNFTMYPVNIPEIIMYNKNKGIFETRNEILELPNRDSTSNKDALLDWTNELTNQSLIEKLKTFYSFNAEELTNFLDTFKEENEILSIARGYLIDITDSNSNLNNLLSSSMNLANKAFLVYLMANMLSSDLINNNALSRLVKALSIIVGTYINNIEGYVANGYLVAYKENEKVYVFESTWLNAGSEIDNTAIVGAALNSGVVNGPLYIPLKDLEENEKTYIDAYSSFKTARQLEIETSMKQTLVTIYIEATKKIIAKYKEETSLENDSGLLTIMYNYLSGLSIVDISDIETTSQNICTDLIFNSLTSKEFIRFFNMYSNMSNDLTTSDCSLLAGASLVVLELGANIEYQTK